jgi:hypothetical protein
MLPVAPLFGVHLTGRERHIVWAFLQVKCPRVPLVSRVLQCVQLPQPPRLLERPPPAPIEDRISPGQVVSESGRVSIEEAAWLRERARNEKGTLRPNQTSALTLRSISKAQSNLPRACVVIRHARLRSSRPTAVCLDLITRHAPSKHELVWRWNPSSHPRSLSRALTAAHEDTRGSG